VQLVDANVLLYAVNEDAPHHEPARDWLDGALGENEPVAFAWIVLLAFLRLATRAGLFPSPLTVEQAADVVEHWLEQPAAVVLHPSPRHLGLLRGLLHASGTAANLVNDAHLAALALEHGARIVSYDRDFGRFEGVRCGLPES
jgi:uncharacterized protein